MANEIQNKLGSRTAMTITLASLASSTTRGGRQTDLVSNTAAQYTMIEVAVSVMHAGTPTADTGVYVHLIRGNGTERQDGAGASDAAITVLGAPLLGFIPVGSTPSLNQVLKGLFTFANPGREWGIAVWHDMGSTLHATGSNHAVAYVPFVPEIQ